MIVSSCFQTTCFLVLKDMVLFSFFAVEYDMTPTTAGATDKPLCYFHDTSWLYKSYQDCRREIKGGLVFCFLIKEHIESIHNIQFQILTQKLYLNITSFTDFKVHIME